MTNETNLKKNTNKRNKKNKKKTVLDVRNVTDVTSKSSITVRLLIYTNKEYLRAFVYILQYIHVAITSL